ncbi:MAG: FkbM family methyltransferase, partial [Blastocatellia bacterium]
ELNGWLESALRQANRVVDVGANDGYFTFGCAAAFRRLGKTGEIVAFEPMKQHFDTLKQSIKELTPKGTRISLIQNLVGAEIQPGMTTLDAVCWQTGDSQSRAGALVKIDVEGAELDVLAGAGSWLNPSNYFLIEVHRESYLEIITRLFADKGLTLERIDHRPLWLIGGEYRDDENWWLVSKLDSVKK